MLKTEQGVYLHPSTTVFKGTSFAIEKLAEDRAKEERSYVFKVFSEELTTGRREKDVFYGYGIPA